MSLSSFVCVVWNKMVDNGPGVTDACVMTTSGAWVVLNTSAGRVGPSVDPCVGPCVVRGRRNSVVGKVMICCLVGLFGVCGCGGVVRPTDGPKGFLAGGVVFCCSGNLVVLAALRFGPKRQITWEGKLVILIGYAS